VQERALFAFVTASRILPVYLTSTSACEFEYTGDLAFFINTHFRCMALTAPWTIEERLVSLAFLISCLRLIFRTFSRTATLPGLCESVLALRRTGRSGGFVVKITAKGEDEPDEQTVNSSWAFIKPT